MNDGKVDRRGRFVAGYMDMEESEPLCGLYSLGADLKLQKLDDGIICSNGPCWSLDDRTFYFADSTRKVIYAYDYDTATGGVANRRLFASFATQRGYPDGATVDAEGLRLVLRGLFRPADPLRARRHHRPHGRASRRLDHQHQLRRTQSRHRLHHLHGAAHRGRSPPEREAGGLFAVHGLGVRGMPEPRFAG